MPDVSGIETLSFATVSSGIGCFLSLEPVDERTDLQARSLIEARC